MEPFTITIDQVVDEGDLTCPVTELHARRAELVEGLEGTVQTPELRELNRTLYMRGVTAAAISAQHGELQAKAVAKRALGQVAALAARVRAQVTLAEREAAVEKDENRRMVLERHARTLRDALKAAEIPWPR